MGLQSQYQIESVGLMERKDLQGLTIEELKQFAAELGEAPFRGKQLFKWIHKGARDFSVMTDFSEKLREKLQQNAYIGGVSVEKIQHDKKDGTRKFLYGLQDGNAVEGVFMKYSYGNSLCVSSQVGCRMGCAFCASALHGLVRNLTAGEMLSQVYEAERVTGEKINHIVVMGMGEPFDNYENLRRFLELLHHKDGKNMSYRHMTVSTSGILPGIRRFAEDFPQANLAISLHRAEDKGRSSIMPVNRAYPLAELLQTAREYAEKTGRRVTFEYTLISGENDRPKDVELLQQKLTGMLCHVNLIPLNEVKETGFLGSSRRRAEEVAAQLERAGIPATVRRELGSEIDGACGQLRLKEKSFENHSE